MNIPNQIEEGAILPVYKPLGWTSFDVVRKIKYLAKRAIPKLKIGHAGTLDPLAEGLLIICTQKMTKQVDAIHLLPKTYIATITFGANRPSYDKETEISETFETNHLSREIVETCLTSFLGKQSQFPPIFSAVKSEGKPMYLKARKGIDVEVKAKEVEFYSIQLIDYELPNIKVELTVSKGTYIRSFAYDLGVKLNTGAYLDHLVRNKIGKYTIEESLSMSKLETAFNLDKTETPNL